MAPDDELFALVDRWADVDADDAESVEAEIRRRFEETLAILVLDVKGFSRSVTRDGLLAFLARISHMRNECLPVIDANGGRLVKFVGDDIVAVFDHPDHALVAATTMAAADFGADPEHPFAAFELSIGIGYGPVLHVPHADLWGDQMNRAFKLGEDTADAGEIMLTEAAWDALSAPPPGVRRHSYRVSGLDLIAFVVTV